MKRLFLILCLSLCPFLTQASEMAEIFKPSQKNEIKIGDKVTASIFSIFGNWNNGAFKNIRLEQDKNKISVDYDVKYPEANGIYKLRIDRKEDSLFSFDVSGTLPDALTPGLQYVQFTLPIEDIDSISVKSKDKEIIIAIPEKKEKAKLLEDRNSEKCTLKLKNGDIFTFSDYNTMLYIQDNRQWGSPDISIRFWLRKAEKDFKLSFLMNYQENIAYPVPLGNSANSFRQDEIADDKKGGWTDQGKSNDLRMMPAGTYCYGKIPFIVAAEEYGRKAGTVVTAGSVRNIAVAEVDLPLPPNLRAGGLALLHCSAWTPNTLLGEIDVFYDETGVQTIPVVGGTDAANWWGAAGHQNAQVVWKSSNPQMPVGVHASFFTLNGRSANRLRFRIMNPNAVWMILGVTLLKEPVKIEQKEAKQLITKADKDWLPVNFTLNTIPNSPMDFSFINKELAPAGKWGRVIVSPEGQLSFENAKDRKLRLYGTNLCNSACFPEKQDAEFLTDYLLSMGINSIRIHHHDSLLVKQNEGELELDPVNLDRLDYLIAQCRKKGIYITTDLYTSRNLRSGELSELQKKYPGESPKLLLLTTDEGTENWKKFARLWLTHRNPYTGLSLAEDPVLVFLNLVNEDTLTFSWKNCQPVVEAYEKYAKAQGISQIRTEIGDPYFGKFLYEFQVERLKIMENFVKEELKAKCMLTSCNFGGNQVTTMIRNNFDVADDHMYVGHPTFLGPKWSLPHAYQQGSTLEREAPVPGCLFPGIIYGKPFFITELNFCAPVETRSEGALLTGAYSSLQDISGVYRFNFTHSLNKLHSQNRSIVPFESINDPVMQISDRIISAMFLRGDVKSSDIKISYTIPEAFWEKQSDSGYPWIRSLGLIARVGAVFEKAPFPGTFNYKNLPPEIKKRFERFEKERITVSSTDEISLDVQKGIMTVNTPRCTAVTLPKGKSANAGLLSVSSPDCFQTIAAISRDGSPLESSKDIVLFQMTNICASGEIYRNEERTIMEKYGSSPLLLLRGKAEISLKINSEAKVFALNIEGKVLGETASRFSDGTLHFTADTGSFPGGVFAYSIKR